MLAGEMGEANLVAKAKRASSKVRLDCMISMWIIALECCKSLLGCSVAGVGDAIDGAVKYHAILDRVCVES